MIRYLLTFLTVVGFNVFANAQVTEESQLQESMRLINLAQEGKDGSYEVTELFAQCAGLYDSLGKYLQEYDGVQDNMNGLSRGAKLTASYFWMAHSKVYEETVEHIQESSATHFKSQLSLGGVEAVSDKMTECSLANNLQAEIIKSLRKTY